MEETIVQSGTSAENPQSEVKPELTSADLAKQIELLKKKSTEAAPVEVTAEPPKPVETVPPATEIKPEEIVKQFQQPVVPQVQQQTQQATLTPPVQPNNTEQLEQWFQESLQNGKGLAATIAVFKTLNQPIIQETKAEKLKSEIMRLATSPNTHDTFIMPEIQNEMQNIIKSDPQRWVDETGLTRPEYYADLFNLARGRLNIVPKMNNVVIPASPVEGRSKPTAPPTVDITGKSASELEQIIRQMTK